MDELNEVYLKIQNNSGINQSLEEFKLDTLERLRKTDGVIENVNNITKEYKQKLVKYNNSIFKTKLKKIILTKMGHKHYWEFYKMFSYLPQIYFNSEKFLRTQWYNYEASAVI